MVLTVYTGRKDIQKELKNQCFVRIRIEPMQPDGWRRTWIGSWPRIIWSSDSAENISWCCFATLRWHLFRKQLTLLPDGVTSRSADGGGVHQLMVELAPAGDVTRLEEAAGSGCQLDSDSRRESLQVKHGSHATFSWGHLFLHLISLHFMISQLTHIMQTLLLILSIQVTYKTTICNKWNGPASLRLVWNFQMGRSGRI